MANWEYCEINYADSITIFYAPGGIKVTHFDWDTVKKDRVAAREFEQWKRETGLHWMNIMDYLHYKLICQLLADSWEWWQASTSAGGYRRDIFRRPVGDDSPTSAR